MMSPTRKAPLKMDGTARVQTVFREHNPLYYGLIERFGQATGVPVVLNTSFNLRGMPVVETPKDALRCFLSTDMDALYLGHFKVARPDPARISPFTTRGWKLVIENEMGWGVQAVRARYESPDKKKTVPIAQHPVLVGLCASLDGKRSLVEALTVALQGQRPDAANVAIALQFVQGLLRQGAMKLRVGSVEL